MAKPEDFEEEFNLLYKKLTGYFEELKQNPSLNNFKKIVSQVDSNYLPAIFNSTPINCFKRFFSKRGFGLLNYKDSVDIEDFKRILNAVNLDLFAEELLSQISQDHLSYGGKLVEPLCGFLIFLLIALIKRVEFSKKEPFFERLNLLFNDCKSFFKDQIDKGFKIKDYKIGFIEEAVAFYRGGYVCLCPRFLAYYSAYLIRGSDYFKFNILTTIAHELTHNLKFKIIKKNRFFFSCCYI